MTILSAFRRACAPPPPLDRRTHVRQPCILAIEYRILLRADLGSARSARSHDISLGGLNLIAAESIPVGVSLALRVACADQKLHVVAEVRHAHREPTGEWRVGCAFTTPLQPAQLDALLGPGG